MFESPVTRVPASAIGATGVGCLSGWHISARLSVALVATPMFSLTLLAHFKQRSSHHVDVGLRGCYLAAMGVLCQAVIARRLEAQDPLEHTDRVPNTDPRPRLLTIQGLDRILDLSAAALASVGEVPRCPRTATEEVALSVMGLITPYPVSQLCRR
jgi:hypothetical protein